MRTRNELETERTVLRWFQPTDLDAVIDLLSNPNVMRFSLDGVHSREKCEEFLASCLKMYDKRGYGLFAIIEKATDEFVGYCGFYHHIMGGREEVEVAYRLHPKAWNRGIGTEVVRRVHRYGFEELGFERLIANIDPENHASARVAEKCGMRYEVDSLFQGRLPVRIYAIERPHRSGAQPA